MDYGLFGVRFLFFNTKKERRSIDELLIYFATPPIIFTDNILSKCRNVNKPRGGISML